MCFGSSKKKQKKAERKQRELELRHARDGKQPAEGQTKKQIRVEYPGAVVAQLVGEDPPYNYVKPHLRG
jgi:hypothetical protein